MNAQELNAFENWFLESFTKDNLHYLDVGDSRIILAAKEMARRAWIAGGERVKKSQPSK